MALHHGGVSDRSAQATKVASRREVSMVNPAPAPKSTLKMLRETVRRIWNDHLKPNGALDDDGHRADVLRICRADPDFRRLRRAEEGKRLNDDYAAAVRFVRHDSKPSAKSIVMTFQAAQQQAQPVQMWLPMQEFAQEKYEVPGTGETKAGTDLLLVEAEACINDYLMRAAEMQMKAQHLRAVVDEAKR